VIALELGVGECDLALDDMVRGAAHGACPVEESISHRPPRGHREHGGHHDEP